MYSIGPRLCACASSYQNRLDFGGFNTQVRLPSHLMGTPNLCDPVLVSFTRYSGQARALYMNSRPTVITDESRFEVRRRGATEATIVGTSDTLSSLICSFGVFSTVEVNSQLSRWVTIHSPHVCYF